MNEQELVLFSMIAVLAAAGTGAAGAPFILARLLRPRALRSPRAAQTYECGNPPFGQSWDFRHGIAFYIYALIFLAFEVDILYLFPVATAFGAVQEPRGMILVTVFITMLACGLVYAWRAGVFSWEAKKKLY